MQPKSKGDLNGIFIFFLLLISIIYTQFNSGFFFDTFMVAGVVGHYRFIEF